VSGRIKAAVRPIALPCIHAWQRFWDNSRTTVRLGPGRLREMLLNFRFSRRALGKAVPILEDINGTRFVLYPWDRPTAGKLVRRRHDTADFRAISKLMRPGFVAFDVGANVGIHSVLLSQLCKPDGRVWAFEPVPETYWRLKETLALNRCENVATVQAAICDKTGTAEMNLFESRFSEWNSLGNPSMYGTDGNRISPTLHVKVPTQTLDQFCKSEGIEYIHFLKVDVEGFELTVFRGAAQILTERRVDCICFEISAEPLRGAGIESKDVFEALESYGYRAYRFDERLDAFTGPVTDSLDSWTNFFASWRDLRDLQKWHETREDRNWLRSVPA